MLRFTVIKMYLKIIGGHVRNVIVATRNGVKYLKTEAYHDTPDNLLSLPDYA